MAYITNQVQNTGLYLPTTTVFDTSQIQSLQGVSEELKQLLVVLYQAVNNISIAANAKETGIYNLQEFVNGKVFFDPNPVSLNSQPRSNFRKVFYLTNLPPGVTAFNHLIPLTASYSFTNMWGMANDTIGFNYYPINAGGAATISINGNLTQLVITNNTAVTFNVVYVYVEYLQT